MTSPPQTRLFGQRFDIVDTKTAVGYLDHVIESKRGGIAIAKNVALAVYCARDVELASFYESADLVVVDGRPLVYVSYLLGPRFPEMVGKLIWFQLLEQAAAMKRTAYFWGGQRDTVERAVRRATTQYAGLQILGFHDGFATGAAADSVVAEIEALRPDIVFFGMPTPMKERACDLIRRRLPETLCAAVGGIFEVLAGEKKLAPDLLSHLCLEWTYRLAQDPRRLWRRYLTTNIAFVGLLGRELLFRAARQLPTLLNRPRSLK